LTLASGPKSPRVAIDQALTGEAPAIVHCVVPADELPDIPHMEVGKIENCANAKVKETILAVTGVTAEIGLQRR